MKSLAPEETVSTISLSQQIVLMLQQTCVMYSIAALKYNFLCVAADYRDAMLDEYWEGI